MNKTAKPLYTDPDDVKAYESRKATRRKLLTAAGSLVGGWGGAIAGTGIAGATSRSLDRRRMIIGALVGAGLGAGVGGLGARKLTDMHTNYMESAGLDPTVPSLKAKIQGYGAKEASAHAARPIPEKGTHAMDKQASYRSASRRAVLTKTAGMFPWGLALGATAAGLGIAGLNGYLDGKARDARRRRENRMHSEIVDAISNQSRLSRTGLLGGGGAGVGALIGGLTAGEGKKARNAAIGAVIGGAAGTAVANADKIKDFIAKSFPNKAAEAAYAEGFFKAAEVAGVDPAELVKRAQLASMLGKGIGMLGRGARWFGGTAAGKGIANAAQRVGNSAVGQGIANGARRVADSRFGQGVANGAKRYWELATGGAEPISGAFRFGKGDLKNIPGYFQTYWQGLNGSMGKNVASELWKSLGARAGTIGGAAWLTGKLGGGPDNAQDQNKMLGHNFTGINEEQETRT